MRETIVIPSVELDATHLGGESVNTRRKTVAFSVKKDSSKDDDNMTENIDSTYYLKPQNEALKNVDYNSLSTRINRSIRNFYEDYQKVEIDDMLACYELQNNPIVVSNEPNLQLSNNISHLLFQFLNEPSSDTNTNNKNNPEPIETNPDILLSETNKIIAELAVGIFAYNSIPQCEFVPSKKKLHCCNVVINGPYKNSLRT